MRTVLAVIAFAFATGVVLGQPVAQPQSQPLPPGQPVSQMRPVVASDPAALPGGTDVSQPLQPVGPDPIAPSLPAVPEVKAIAPERPIGPLGPSWDTLELLYWWPTRQPIPALAYAPNSGISALTGANGTLLAGGHAISSQPSAGGRFTLGYSLNDAETFGIEGTYLFLGTRSFNETVRNFAGSPITSFGLPYTNASTGASELLLLGQGSGTQSFLNLSTSVRVQGGEVNTVANIMDEKNVKLNFLLGWRNFQTYEGLSIAQTQYRYTGAGGVFQTADQFDARNSFNGGQLGLYADVRRGIVFCEVITKVAFGQNYEVVKTGGMTHLLLPGGGGQTFAGSGIYVQPSNLGRTASGVFAVLPEGTIKFGFRLGDSGRLYVGYSFLYLTDAVRPGDQIDRTLYPAQVPLVSGTGPVSASDRPARIFTHSDFWVQGVVIGLETRY